MIKSFFRISKGKNVKIHLLGEKEKKKEILKREKRGKRGAIFFFSFFSFFGLFFFLFHLG